MGARRLAFCRRVVAAAVIANLGGGLSPAGAGCVSAWTTKLSEAHDITHRRTQFQPNDQFVLCIRLDADAFVSIWDAPPAGDISRLYPNIVTHGSKNATVRAERMTAGSDHCYGDPSTFPLFFSPDQGFGPGKLWVSATTLLDKQPSLQDYAIPGQSMRRATMDQVVGNYRSADNCGDAVQEYVYYTIVK